MKCAGSQTDILRIMQFLCEGYLRKAFINILNPFSLTPQLLLILSIYLMVIYINSEMYLPTSITKCNNLNLYVSCLLSSIYPAFTACGDISF